MKQYWVLFCLMFSLCSCAGGNGRSVNSAISQTINTQSTNYEAEKTIIDDKLSQKDAYNVFLASYRADNAVTIAIMGDSTTCGYGANSNAYTWPTDNTSHGFLDTTNWGPNWGSAGNPLFIQTDSSGITLGYIQDALNEDGTPLIPGAPQLLQKYLRTKNSSSKVYNYGGSGWKSTNVYSRHVAYLAGLSPKPQVVFIAYGINDAKYGNNGVEARTARNTAIDNIRQWVGDNGMLPVLVAENNVTDWDVSMKLSCDQWVEMPNWGQWAADVGNLAQTRGIPFIDLYTPFYDANRSNHLKWEYMFDSFHPGSAGYQAIASAYAAWFDYYNHQVQLPAVSVPATQLP